MEWRGHSWVSSLLPSSGSKGSNSDHQAWLPCLYPLNHFSSLNTFVSSYWMVKYESPQAGISATKAVSASEVLTIDIFSDNQFIHDY